MAYRGVVRGVNDHIVERPAGQFLVRARRREVHVAGDVIARLDHHFRQDVLGAASLMRRDDFIEAVVGPYGVTQ